MLFESSPKQRKDKHPGALGNRGFFAKRMPRLRQRASSGYTRGKHHLEVRSTKMPKSDRGDATFEQLETVEQAWQRYYETKGDNMSPHCVEIAKSAFFTAFLAAQSAG
jgi:hypothetical protein